MITDLTNKAYLSAITVTNIFQSFTYKMAAEIDWHRYGTKLRHCHRMYNKLSVRKLTFLQSVKHFLIRR